MARATSNRLPGVWEGVAWAREPEARGGGTSSLRLTWRAARAALSHGKTMRHWMAVVSELKARGIVEDLHAEYLRAVRPYVNRGTGFNQRVAQLVDHFDWLEMAFKPAAFERLASGKPLVIAELTAPRGYDFMRVQMQQAPAQSPEGELVLTLSLQRSADVQHKPQPVDAGVLAFSRFRIDGTPCLVIGGVRGQRHPVMRMSAMEISQVLQGWKPAVLMVRVAQALARHWGLHLVGLSPGAHRLHGWSYRWNKRYRDSAEKIYASYDALWDHFEATPGPSGWVNVPLTSDEKLAATALSPEKRGRQTRRADYWIRTRNLLRVQFKNLLLRPDREARLSRVTEQHARDSMGNDYDDDLDLLEDEDDDAVPSRVLQTGPGSLI
jgi:uncharacterized protein VirK/YbjX